MSFITPPGVIVPPLTAGGVAYGTGNTAKVSAAGVAGQVLLSAGAGVPVFGSVPGSFGTDLSSEDYSLTLASGISGQANQTIYMQAVSLDGISELMVIYSTTSIHAVVYNSSTNTFGTPALVRTVNLSNIVNSVAPAKISSTSVLICSLLANSTGLETVVLTVSGSTITVGTALATTLAAASTLIIPNTRLVTVGSSYVLNYFTTADGLPKFRAITVSGSTPSIGAELAYAGGTESNMHHSYAHSATVLMHFSMTANLTVFALPITVSGTTLTAGTQATVTTVAPSFFSTAPMASSRYALLYQTTVVAQASAAVVSVTGTVASISVAALVLSSSTSGYPVIQVFNNQAFVLPTSSFPSGDINVLTDTAGVATLGTSLSNLAAGSFVGYLSTGKVFFAVSAAGDSSYYQYGIVAGSPKLEKTFQNVTNTSVVTATTQASGIYRAPLNEYKSASGNTRLNLRTSTGKIAVVGTSSGSTFNPFTISIDGTSPGKFQQNPDPYYSFNDGISDAVGWGIPTSQTASATTVQLRKVTLA